MIEVEDRTETVKTVEDLDKKVTELAKITGKALESLSDNDQKIVAQVKDALEEITGKTLFLSRQITLLSDVFEKLFISDDKKQVSQLSWHEYKELVSKLK
jgi:hypothetical protein